MSTRKAILIIILAMLLLWGWNFGRWDLWPPDETRYVQVAREILHSGNWFALTFNKEPYPDKPPLVFWIMASLLHLNNNIPDEWLMRLPSVFSAFLIVILVFLLGQKLWDTRTGLFSALILMTIPGFALEVPTAKLDIIFSLFILISITIFLHIHFPNYRLNFFQWLGFWVCLALAILTKGPLALVIVLGTIIIFAIIQKNWRIFTSLRPLYGLLLTLVIILAWFIPQAIVAEGGFIKNQLLHQNITRYVNFPKHRAPVWYYFQQLFLGEVAPWGLFLPLAIYGFWKQRKKIAGELPSKYAFIKFLLIWFIFPLIFLTLSPSKRLRYLLPAFPAIALLLGWLWAKYLPAKQTHLARFWRLLALIIALILLIIAMSLPLFSPVKELLILNKIYFGLQSLLAISLLFLIASGILIYFVLRPPELINSYLVIFSLIFILLFIKFGIINPAINERYSPVKLNAFIESHLTSETVVGVYGPIKEYYQVYGDYFLRKISNAEQIAEFTTGGTEPRLFFIRYGDWRKKRKQFFPLFQQLRLKPLGIETSQDYVFMFFRTKPQFSENVRMESPSSDLNFIIIGDPHGKVKPLTKIRQQVLDIHKETPIDAIILTGDNLTPKHNFARDVLEQFIFPFHSIIQRNIPFYAVLGNHDLKYSAEEINYPLFNMRGRRYYNQSFGDRVEFFFLDTNTLRNNDSQQINWLRQALSQSKARWKIAVMHVPMFASPVAHRGSIRLAALLEPIFSENSAIDIVLSGHNHLYERLYQKNGVLYITVGGSGKLTRGSLTPSPLRAVGYNKAQSFLWLNFQEDRLLFRAYSITGELIDQGELKHKEFPERIIFTSSALSR